MTLAQAYELDDPAIFDKFFDYSRLEERDATIRGNEGRVWVTHLSASALGGRTRLANHLLNCGADPNQIILEATLLHHTVHKGHIDLAIEMASRGADIDGPSYVAMYRNISESQINVVSNERTVEWEFIAENLRNIIDSRKVPSDITDFLILVRSSGAFKEFKDALTNDPISIRYEHNLIDSIIKAKELECAFAFIDILHLIGSCVEEAQSSLKRNFYSVQNSKTALIAAFDRSCKDVGQTFARAHDLFEDDARVERACKIFLLGFPFREYAKKLPLTNNKRGGGIEFEQLCLNILVNANYTAVATPRGADQGADILAHKDGARFAVQCKDYSRPVGNSAVQEVAGARSHYIADYAVVCAVNGFTKSARELALSNRVVLCSPSNLSQIDDLAAVLEL